MLKYPLLQDNGPSPNGKALDSDSSISRFESLWASSVKKTLLSVKTREFFIYSNRNFFTVPDISAKCSDNPEYHVDILLPALPKLKDTHSQ